MFECPKKDDFDPCVNFVFSIETCFGNITASYERCKKCKNFYPDNEIDMHICIETEMTEEVEELVK